MNGCRGGLWKAERRVVGRVKRSWEENVRKQRTKKEGKKGKNKRKKTWKIRGEKLRSDVDARCYWWVEI